MSDVIGILGGTFDPIHKGHLAIAEKILIDIPLIKKICFIPCHQPVHRSEPHASSSQRLEMLTLAINDHPDFCINTFELERDQPSFTIDTLTALKHKNPDQHFVFIIGYDAWQDFPTWERGEDILNLAHLLIVSRPNYPLAHHDVLEQYHTHDAKDFATYPHGKILLIDDLNNDHSATAFRNHRDQLLHTVPQSVAEYIQKHNLYG